MTLDAAAQAQLENSSETQTDTGRDQRWEHGDGLQSVQEKAEVMLGTTTVTMQNMTSRLLDFFSSASNDTLVACLVGLVAATYLILGRVGLVLIGVLGGILLQATWEGNSQGTAYDAIKAAELKRRREIGLDIVQKVLNMRETKIGLAGDVGVTDQHTQAIHAARRALDFSTFQPGTRAALSNLTDAVINDYVRYWYSPVLPQEDSFPFACRQTLTSFLLAVSSRLARRRPADMFLNFVTNSTSIVVVFLSELSLALMAPGSINTTPSESLQLYLEANNDSHLAVLLDVQQQKRKLKEVSDDILRMFLNPTVYNCVPAQAFLREILAGVIIDITVQSCSKPEWINSWIVYLLEASETESMNTIDARVDDATITKTPDIRTKSTTDQTLYVDDHVEDSTRSQAQMTIEHRRQVSRAEEAMDEAMQEAKRLSELIAAEDMKRVAGESDGVSSRADTTGSMTPTSSHSDLLAASTGSLDGADLGNDATAQLTNIPKSEHVATSFNEILASQQPTALRRESELSESPAESAMTLHNATISIFDDSMAGEKATIRAKPSTEYLIQIEPASSAHRGWMIARKYTDFETLHEVLRRISVVSGVSAFTDKYSTIPGWKNQTKIVLRVSLEQYLRDALSFDRLAESEGMKRFLDKDQGLGRHSPSASKGGFSFPSPAAFETMGKGMLDVLASAPKGAAGGGKALIGGVTGVFGVGQKKQTPYSHTSGNKSANMSRSSLPRMGDIEPAPSNEETGRERSESLRTSRVSLDHMRPPPLQSRASELSPGAQGGMTLISPRPVPDTPLPPHEIIGEHTSITSVRHDDEDTDIDIRLPKEVQQELHLPPPPSEIPDDYRMSRSSTGTRTSPATARNSTSISDTQPVPQLPHKVDQAVSQSSTTKEPTISQSPTDQQTQPKPQTPHPLTEEETRITVELFFAVITELYTLSSAWNIRRTLLSAAKTYLLRPGNPNLEAIRVLLQDSIITSNTSDAAIAAHLYKIRQNALPTPEELKAWPSPAKDEEKEKLRGKAKKLLVEKGMPQALTSVMGAAASGEALGRVFDCLQVERVARGLMFALILQGIRILTQ